MHYPAASMLFDVRTELELIGQPILPLFSDEDRPLFQAMHERVSAGESGAGPSQVFRLLNKRCWVEVTASCLRDGQGAVEEVLYLLRDITERKRGEWRIQGQHEVTRVLAEAGSTAEAAQGVLQVICTSLGWTVGTLWLVDGEAGVLRSVEHWPEGAGPFFRMSRDIPFCQGGDFPGVFGRPASRPGFSTWCATTISPGRRSRPRMVCMARSGFPSRQPERFWG